MRGSGFRSYDGFFRLVGALAFVVLNCTEALAAPRPPDPCYDTYLNSRYGLMAEMFECYGFEPTTDLVVCAAHSLVFAHASLEPRFLNFDHERYEASISEFWSCMYARGALSDFYIALDLSVHTDKFICLFVADMGLRNAGRTLQECRMQQDVQRVVPPAIAPAEVPAVAGPAVLFTR